MTTSEVKPIIVIGMHRSGTKWLSNILCNHPEIIGLQRDRVREEGASGGAMESNVLGRIQGMFGDLSRPDDYIGLIEFWSQTDLFKLSAADKELFYQLKPRPRSYYEVFRVLMDDLATRHQKRFW